MRTLPAMTVIGLLGWACLQRGQSAPPPAPAAAPPVQLAGPLPLPEGPEKTLVVEHCQVCHGLTWIERSGGTEQHWIDRIKRMIRSGATIQPDEVLVLAAYLATALPVRLREPAETSTREGGNP